MNLGYWRAETVKRYHTTCCGADLILRQRMRRSCSNWRKTTKLTEKMRYRWWRVGPAHHQNTIIVVVVGGGGGSGDGGVRLRTCARSKNAACACATTYFRRTWRRGAASVHAPVCSVCTSACRGVTPSSCCVVCRPTTHAAACPYPPSHRTPSTRTSGSRSTSSSRSHASARDAAVQAST